jgi:arylsulfatase
MMSAVSIDRRQFLASLGGAALAAPAPARRPNIIVILADDMGYSDIGCFGSEIDTPNLDRLAKGGIRFTHMYNTARCCPTRASLLTGLYSHQAGVGRMVEDEKLPGYRGRLNESCVTIAEALRGAGYRTLMSGKWHVGEDRPHWPTDRGFDRYYGLISGASNYYSLDPGRKMAIDDKAAEPPDRDFYFTDAFTDNAVRMMDDRKSGQQFFLYLAYTAPHWPLHALEPEIRKYKDRYRIGWDALRKERHERMLRLGIVDRRWTLSPRDSKVPAWADAPDKEWQASRMAVYAAMIDRMDQGIGRVLARVRAMGEEDNTLVMFMADNGGCAELIGRNFRNLEGKVRTAGGRTVRYGNLSSIPPGPPDTFQSYGPEWAQVSNTPFREYKQRVHEGGIASPFVAYWPAAIRARGAILPQQGHVIDVMPTALDAADVEYPREYQGRAITPVEGVSLLPAMRSGKPVPRPKPLHWEHFGNRAIRDGDWKLVALDKRPWELYNLAADRTELNDLAAKEPDRARKLEAAWNDWARRANVLRPA